MEKGNKKGGRPKKEYGQKKSYRMNLRLDTREYYTVLAKAKNAGMTLSKFVRGCMQDGYVKERISIDQMNHVRQLSGMANNLNQLARKANVQGFHSIENECRKLILYFDNLIKSLTK